uniref:Three finger toxin n=2 Tax=Serpentes TaxID=8570 RepID=A0A098LY55_PYTRG
MKTLLLSLVVVAFVCLEPGDAVTCHSCNGTICLGSEQCADTQTTCFKKTVNGDFLGLQTVRGCADSCPTPGTNEIITCCGYDHCNH